MESSGQNPWNTQFSKDFENTKWDAQQGIPYYNPSKAEAYLHKCPGLKNYHLVIVYQNTSADLTAEYTAVEHMIASIDPSWNTNVTLNAVPFNTWLGVVGAPGGLDKTSVGKVDITENLWIEDYPDPQDYLTNLLRAGSNYDIGYFNNPTYNSLDDKADVTSNPTQRYALYLKAEKIALRQGAWVAMGNVGGFNLLRPTIHGIVTSGAYGPLVPINDQWSNVSVS